MNATPVDATPSPVPSLAIPIVHCQPLLRNAPPLRHEAISGIDYAVLTGLVAAAVLGAAVPTGDRDRALFVPSETTVGVAVARLPLPEPHGPWRRRNGQQHRPRSRLPPRRPPDPLRRRRAGRTRLHGPPQRPRQRRRHGLLGRRRWRRILGGGRRRQIPRHHLDPHPRRGLLSLLLPAQALAAGAAPIGMMRDSTHPAPWSGAPPIFLPPPEQVLPFRVAE